MSGTSIRSNKGNMSLLSSMGGEQRAAVRENRIRDRAKNTLSKIRTKKDTAKERIRSLKEKIFSINRKISREIARPLPDNIRLQKLKRKRLHLMDNIHSLS